MSSLDSEEIDRETPRSWMIKCVLAMIGCFLGTYVGQEVIGGGALGWTAGGAIIGGFCQPLFKSLLARNKRRHLPPSR
jgi:hypothetical protein